MFFGIFSRFFFGVATFNQIFISIAIAFVFFGLSLFEEFWETQFQNIFNENGSKCLHRLLAFILAFGFALDFLVGWYLAKKNILTFENRKYHPYAKSFCNKQCFKTPKERLYLSNSSLVSLAWFSFIPMTMLYFALTSSVKYKLSKMDYIKYGLQFSNKKKVLIRFILLLVINIPIIISAWVQLHSWKKDLIFKFVCSFMWVVLYRWIAPLIKKITENDIKSDMFAPWMQGDDTAKDSLI